MLDAFPVFTSPAGCQVEADVIIDFSHPSALAPLLDYAAATRTPAVIATTGLSSDQVALIRETSARVPLFFTANMSLGVNLLVELAKKAAAVLGGQFDIEIIEKHHNQKIDAPSGTALMLADAISGVLPEEPQYVYDRHAVRRKRGKNEIGLHAVRGGTIGRRTRGDLRRAGRGADPLPFGDEQGGFRHGEHQRGALPLREGKRPLQHGRSGVKRMEDWI